VNPLDQTADFADCWDTFEPIKPLNFADWAAKYVVTDTGKPYDALFYPHITAPGGPVDAFDDHRVRVIVLQWGVRLGKTFFGSCSLLNAAHQSPSPMMLASSREKLSIDVTARLYEMVRRGPLSDLLVQPEHLQKRDLVEFQAARCYVAWSRSPSSLADKNCRVGHANEVDKWEQAGTSTEGDPLDLFLDRFNDFLPSRKIVIEGTPSVKHRSRVERWRLLGSNCRLWVPCRRCGRYQVLILGNEKLPHGIKWQAGPDGRTDVDTAVATARYVCEHCHGDLQSEDRPWMLRRGVWVPEGCGVDDAAALEVATAESRPAWRGWSEASWITGTPLRLGEVASYQLASWYAQAIPGWGDFARRFLTVKSRPQSLRAFVNQWAAETWEASERRETWEKLGQRLIDPELAEGVAPGSSVVITAGIDKQLDHYVWLIVAWDHREMAHVVTYGTCKTLDQLDAAVFNRTIPTGHSMPQRVRLALIDSGFRNSVVYRFCRSRIRRGRVYPCKGASSPLGTFVQKRILSKNTSSPGQKIVLVDTVSTQDWIDGVIAGDEAGGSTASLFAGSLGQHQDFLEQLLNDGPVGSIAKDGNYRERWERLNPNVPNDYRDAWRYAFAALKLLNRGAAMRPRPVVHSDSPTTPDAGTVRVVEL
jgi:phage terminase large subunit GpA-like protein